ncbi:MAG: hypothetical protein Q6K90_04220, partial [Gloeomargarita sp. HHBFW_bins_162]
VRLILNKAGKEALLIKNYPLFGVRKQTFSLDLVSLEFKEETDSDNDTVYYVFLAFPSIPSMEYQRYMLKYSSTRQAVEDYWRFNPDIQLLKGFVRCEEIFPDRSNSGQ